MRSAHPSLRRPAPLAGKDCGGCHEPIDFGHKFGAVFLCDSCLIRLKQRARDRRAARKPVTDEAVRDAFRNDERRKRQPR